MKGSLLTALIERINMAKQHFYSRVPSRVSLYNKCDGFDTFAKSKSLSDELTLGELSAVYKDKLDIHNPTRLRRGEIPTVYSQMMLSDGDVVQTSIKYLATDFTGERSAYLAHSLILNVKERAAVFYGDANDSFSPNMFINDISVFKLTDPMAAANPGLADKAYTPRPVTTTAAVISKYNAELMKGLIYAVVSSLCDNGVDVCFRLPVEDALASDEALAIINAIMSVLPYDMRERLSFASFVSTTDAYRGFKLRCVSADCAVARNTVFYDFASEMAVRPALGYERYTSLAAFLYSLMENERLRSEFHIFLSAICAKYNIRITDIQTLSEIVFLFWQCSGFYVESSILPNDESIITFLDIYGRFREGLTVDQRVRAYRPLARYANMHIAIPAQIFDRMTNLYVGECVPAKAVALDVALHLIHVDLMRDRLFNFITRNYDREVDSVKAVVVENLARVFYGGFLQQKILSFFDVHFIIEPTDTKDIILDKLLLTIRTPEIQRQIVAFFDRQYTRMNDEQHMRIYNTCLEMIPECDGLSALLVGFINRNIGRESEKVRGEIGGRLLAILEHSIKVGNSRVAAIFLNENGFCEEIAAKFILGQHIGEEMLIGILAGMPAHLRAEKLMKIYRTNRNMSQEEYRKLISTFANTESNLTASTVYQVMAADAAAVSLLPDELLDEMRKCVIYPAVKEKIFDVFIVKLGKDGVSAVVEYAKAKGEILSSHQYIVLEQYISIVDNCLKGNTKGAFRVIAQLPEDVGLRQDIAEHLLMCQLDRATQREAVVCNLELAINYLRSGYFRFDTLYPRYKKHFIELREEESNVVLDKIDPPERRGAADAIKLLLEAILPICEASHTLATNVCHKSSGLERVFGDFFALWGAGARMYLKSNFKDGYDGVVDIMDDLVRERNSAISSFEDVSDLLFKRFKQ